jgi:regulator of protease activity HflC (stomatin/prohibitin superfamily)
MANLSIPSLPGAGGRSPAAGSARPVWRQVAAAAILLYIISPFYTVGEYERTVVTRFGQFHSLAGPGLHFRIPFVNGLETFPIGIQRMQKDHLNTYTVDNQELDALVTLNFRIPEAEVRRVFTTNRDYRANLESFMIDRFKREMGKINITQVAAHRGDVALSVQKSLETEALSLFGISIVDFQINDIRYTEQYRKAVDSAAIAKAKVEQSEQERRQAEVVAQRQKIQAEGEANAGARAGARQGRRRAAALDGASQGQGAGRPRRGQGAGGSGPGAALELLPHPARGRQALVGQPAGQHVRHRSLAAAQSAAGDADHRPTTAR